MPFLGIVPPYTGIPGIQQSVPGFQIPGIQPIPDVQIPGIQPVPGNDIVYPMQPTPAPTAPHTVPGNQWYDLRYRDKS